MRVLDRKCLYLNSIGESNKSAFNILLPQSIFQLVDSTYNYIRVYFKSIIIPNNFNNINSTNNAYIWNGTPYTLPTGDPDIYDIIAELNSNGLQATYDETTSLITIGSTGNLNLLVSNTCANVLGFYPGIYTTPKTGTIPVNVHLTQSIFLNSSIAVESAYEIINKQIQSSEKMIQLPIIVPRYTNIVYQDDIGRNAIEMDNPKYQNISFFLTDDSGNTLNVLSDWSMVLIVEVVQDQDLELLKVVEGLARKVEDIRTFQHINILGEAIASPALWSVP